MKIYLLPNLSARPLPNIYPPHNKADYGVEQDFVVYLRGHPRLLTDDPDAADWHLLPVHWTRYYVQHGCPDVPGLLQQEIRQRVIDASRTFTICQYDNGPLDCPDGAVQFLASRRGSEGIDIPLMSDPHEMPPIKPEKKWLASFIGRLRTQPMRYDMAHILGAHDFIDIQDGNKGVAFFVNQMLESYVALCPRGYGGSSFRFYEAMSLGVCPMLIGDIDNRPFKKWLDWGKISAYAGTLEEAKGILEVTAPKEWIRRGECAREVYERDLTFGQWCKYVLKELEDVNRI